MKEKICIIYNYAQHYRQAIFKALDQSLNIDFFFGDTMEDVRKLDYKVLSGKVVELKNIIIFKKPIYWQKGALKLIFKPYNKYIILGEYYCISTWLILVFSLFTKKKIYLWTHGWYGNEGLLKRIIKKVFFCLADKLLLYGNFARDLMVKEGFKSDKLIVIYNSLDYDRQLQIRRKLHFENIYKDYFKNDFPTLIFIGRLTVVKKLDQIIEAQRYLDEKGFKVNVVFVGDGEMKTWLENLVPNDLKSRVWFYGESYNENMNAKLIYNADMCLSPGNVGLTAIHALMYGTPVLTHSNFSNQMPEFECIIDGYSGLFFKQDDIADICRSIQEMSDLNIDRDKIRLNCYENIDMHFNPNYQVEVISKELNND